MNAFEDLSPRQLAYKAKREEQHQQILDCIKEQACAVSTRRERIAPLASGNAS